LDNRIPFSKIGKIIVTDPPLDNSRP